ncbi:uncharacterized protein LACBIDRAFT_294539 [Laccaria bicolor S238N-H82]|uniref:Predicted protein n=1 Tax=Laccaria bicolor (strain S238N-H82 / ATCC MYA-4686) TaxID=486041 RepID=B0DDB8_LACBS|nr:uncharacterized protein LACBIDRAFT_294539 [Laccaria bicolor S238N-H82]EDR07442.1 predicted protein [Laccaria bicolor S238N-H82]|eukprot:XP_001881834.1 predicted protein [Laccaria bicolor S238N-H82]
MREVLGSIPIDSYAKDYFYYSRELSSGNMTGNRIFGITNAIKPEALLANTTLAQTVCHPPPRTQRHRKAEHYPPPPISPPTRISPRDLFTLRPGRREALERSLDEQATTPAHPFVTVRDVLSAVHDSIRVFAIEFHHSPPTYNLWGSPTGMVQIRQTQAAVSDAHARQLIKEFFPGGSIWAGVSPSPAEPDIWILHVR